MRFQISAFRLRPRQINEIVFNLRNPKFKFRYAVTLMETIFAIGVIMTGLLGLAALIPVAASNAKATIELDRSINESTSAAAAGQAKLFLNKSSLIIFDEPVTDSLTNVGSMTAPYGYQPTNLLQSIQSKLEVQEFGTSGIKLGKLESPGYGHMPLDSGLSSGICLDPVGLPSLAYRVPARIRTVADATAYDSAFVPSRFPYYSERYNVLTPPNQSTASGINAPSWPMSPRMWRATLRAPMYAHPAPPVVPVPIPPAIQRHQLLSASATRFQFRGSGGITAIAGGDENDAPSLLFTSTRLGTNFIDAKADRSSEYSWFATLVPSFFGGSTLRQSIIVVHQRQAPIPQRSNDPLALNEAAYTINDSDENPMAERLCWVGDSTPFTGGSGGEIEIYGSQAISDEIKTNEWVMLSRQPHTLSATAPFVPVAPTGPAVHRWFRVLRVADAEKVANFAMPGGPTTDVWRRWITLDGPDWAFQDEATGTSPLDDTFCTIVTGAVSVLESEVTLQ